MNNKIPGWVVVAGVLFVLAVLFALLLTPFCVVWSVAPGHLGLVSNRGEVSDQTLPAGGPYMVKPWATVYRVNVQQLKNEEPSTVPTKGGLAVEVKAVLSYRLDKARVAEIYRDVGEKYEEKVVDPFFKNAVRDACAEYAPEALYTSEREAVEKNVLARVQRELAPRGFVVDAVMLQDPKLPDVVKGRIEAKVAAEQDAIRMQSVFTQRELEGKANKRVKELEAEAKVIEAKGIADAQALIKKDLDDNYLKYLWVEALKESAKHNNATIYVPTGGDGMPLFKSVHPGKDQK